MGRLREKVSAPQTSEHWATRAAAGRAVRLPAEWSLGWRTALVLFGLFLQFIHSIYFRMVFVPGFEWWDTVEPHLFLLSEVLALAANLGFLVLPFLGSPGRTMRVVLRMSLLWGALTNASRMIRGIYFGDFWYPFTGGIRARHDPYEVEILWDMLVMDVVVHVIFGLALYLNLHLFSRLRSVGSTSADH